MRQGEFNSRYTTNLGRINSLAYGSKMVFTNTDLTSKVVATSSLVKVGGQEFLVATEAATHLTLNEPYLGTTIIATLTNTGVLSSAGMTAATGTEYDQLAIPAAGNTGEVGEKQVTHLQAGAQLSNNDCAFIAHTGYGTAGTEPNALAAGATKLGVSVRDCETDAFAAGIIYRRSDDPNNANMYKAPSDTGAVTTDALMLTRGSSAAYLVGTGVMAGFDNAKTYAPATGFVGAAAASGAAGDPYFINGFGPITSAANADPMVADASSNVLAFFPRSFEQPTSKPAFPARQVVTSTTDHYTGANAVIANSVLLVHGRRYRVKARGASGSGGLTGRGSVTLSENYAGGGIMKVCAGCIDSYTETSGALVASTKQTLVAGDRVALGGRVHEDFFSTVIAQAADGTAITLSTGGSRGTVVGPNSGGAVAVEVDGGGASVDAALYKAVDSAIGTIAVVVTESAASTATTYNYVAQCSNRGTCDAATGLCKCFKGYSNDNCNEQNMLAQ
jgi:hypothetical protein